MRTAFYLFTSTFLITTFALADGPIPAAPAVAALEEVPVAADSVAPKEPAKVEKSSEIKAKLPVVDKTTHTAPVAVAPATSAATGIISAKGEKLAIASGHYARARALLIASLREFDKGLELVDPNALVDANNWRNSVLDRAEDLEHILDPQPRKSRGGVRFDDSTAKTGDAGSLRHKK